MGSELTRSEFLKLLGITAAGVAFLPGEQLLEGLAMPEEAVAATRAYPAISVAKGHSLNANHIATITRVALNNLGGMGRFVHKGDVVVVKPNIYGARIPASACTTNPTVVGTVVKECFKAGAKQVKVMDYPCGGDHVQSYAMSGIGPAAKAAGATVLQMSQSRFRSYSIPKGKAITSLRVYPDIVSANVLIDVPIAKVHGSPQISMACKNLMGCTDEPGRMHNSPNLNQAIVDLVSLLRPDLTVIDGIRTRIANGPGGTDPGSVRLKYTVLACANPVSADAWATRNLLGKSPTSIAQLVNARNMGLGEIDLSKLTVKKVTL